MNKLKKLTAIALSALLLVGCGSSALSPSEKQGQEPREELPREVFEATICRNGTLVLVIGYDYVGGRALTSQIIGSCPLE